MALAAAIFSSCASNHTTNIPLGHWEKEASLVAGPTATPAHSLPPTEYPFDAQGNYIAAWAASGERRFGNPSTSSTWVATSAPQPAAPQPSAEPAAQPAAKVTTTHNPRLHQVSASDTLWSLSRKYGTTVSAIQHANGLSDTTIRTGSTLKIPG